MRIVMRLWSFVNRLGAIVGLRPVDRDLKEEMDFHLHAKEAECRAAGMSENDARLAARRAFGSVALAAEDSRAAWRYALPDSILQDVRYSTRSLLKTPVFTSAVVLTLALGIGVNTAIFTIIDRVMLRPLAVREPDRLAAFGARPYAGIRLSDGPHQRGAQLFSVPISKDFARYPDVFSDVAAVGSFPVTTYLGGATAVAGEPLEQANALLVSGNLFRMLGAPVAIGRMLEQSDDRPGAQPVVVLGHGLWTRRFGRDPAVIGRTIRANGAGYTVVGVAAPAFRGLSPGINADLWFPLQTQPTLMREDSLLEERNVLWVRLIGRLAPGVTIERARARTNELFRRLLEAEAGASLSLEMKKEIDKLSIDLVPFTQGFSDVRSRWGVPLMILMTVVGMVLLIACANIGNLLLARGSGRQREISLRVALGAGRIRLVRQFLTESLMLSALGGTSGLLVADWTVQFLLGVLSTRGAAAIDTRFDGPVLMFAVGATLFSAFLFGSVPAFRATRVDLNTALRGSSANCLGDRRGWNLRRGLVVFQVAVSLCLLVGAGLLLRSLANLQQQDLGFRAESVLIAEIDPQGGGIERGEMPMIEHTLLERIGALPDVSSVSLSLYGLLSGSQRTEIASVDGYESGRQEDMAVRVLFATPAYFKTVGATVSSGRTFDDRDRAGAPLVAVVSESFARHFLGSRPAIGSRFGLDGPESSSQIEIIGTVRDIKISDPRGEAPRLIYRPAAQVAEYLNSIEVRTIGDPIRLVPELRRTIQEAAPALPVVDLSPLSAQVDSSLRQERMLGELTALFGALALMLAAVGLHGVLAYGVAQRTGEIGIRLALGASRRQVLWMVMKQALGWIAAGVVVGLVAALALARLLRTTLFGVEPADPATILAAVAMLVIVAMASAYWPARRAARMNPLMALRFE